MSARAIFFIAFVIETNLAIAICLWALWPESKKAKRGFEVKQTTGETPVIREKGNDEA
jgi:hypothetical protein